MTARRVRIVPISTELLLMMLGGHDWLKMTSDWPDDARLEGVEWATERSTLRLLVHSESFDEVEEGYVITEWSPTFTVTQLDPVLAELFSKVAARD